MIKLKLGSHCNGRGRVSMINTAMVLVPWSRCCGRRRHQVTAFGSGLDRGPRLGIAINLQEVERYAQFAQSQCH